MTEVAAQLRRMPGARHVVLSGGGDGGDATVIADFADEMVDTALDEVTRMGVPTDDLILVQVDSIGSSTTQRPLGSVVWADLLSQAGVNARPLARYMVFMLAAGVIAAFGVMFSNVTLIVGAMAISPDTLPITAAATAIVMTRWGLAARAVSALLAGLTAVCVIGCVLTFVLQRLGLPRSGFVVDPTFLQGLSTVNISTPIVAFTAGVAGMLALETRASLCRGRCHLRHHDPSVRDPRRCCRSRRGGEGDWRAGGAGSQHRHVARGRGDDAPGAACHRPSTGRRRPAMSRQRAVTETAALRPTREPQPPTWMPPRACGRRRGPAFSPCSTRLRAARRSP